MSYWFGKYEFDQAHEFLGPGFSRTCNPPCSISFGGELREHVAFAVRHLEVVAGQVANAAAWMCGINSFSTMSCGTLQYGRKTR